MPKLAAGYSTHPVARPGQEAILCRNLDGGQSCVGGLGVAARRSTGGDDRWRLVCDVYMMFNTCADAELAAGGRSGALGANGLGTSLDTPGEVGASPVGQRWSR